jgi:hypothetical protein
MKKIKFYLTYLFETQIIAVLWVTVLDVRRGNISNDWSELLPLMGWLLPLSNPQPPLPYFVSTVITLQRGISPLRSAPPRMVGFLRFDHRLLARWVLSASTVASTDNGF